MSMVLSGDNDFQLGMHQTLYGSSRAAPKPSLIGEGLPERCEGRGKRRGEEKEREGTGRHIKGVKDISIVYTP